MPNYWCQQPHICTGAGIAPGTGALCDPNDAFCPRGASCVLAGRCAVSGARCLNLGQPCPGAVAGDVCGAAPTVCKIPIDSCSPGDYEQPRVPIGELPAAAAALSQGLAAVKPAGGTPIAPAFDGAVLHLRKQVAANAGHRAALVLATDGGPNGCQGNDEAGIASRLDAARTGAPSLPTYVIGVLDAANVAGIQTITRFATAGGTGMPFILNAGADLGQKFQDALDQIRAKALPCEYTIPAPTKGAIDYGRVNVRYSGPSGQDDLFYVASADRCDPVKGGWYYDVQPAAGTPSTVHVCPATCQRFEREAGGTVQLRFGCRTRVIE
jgi:hypothetical protein